MVASSVAHSSTAVATPTATEPGAATSSSSSSGEQQQQQQQVEALWDAVKWIEDRMEAIDAERKSEVLEASRTAAQNTARVSEILWYYCCWR